MHWFGLLNRFLLLGSLPMVLACQPQLALQVHASQKAFVKGRKLTYQVTRFAPGSQQAQVDTMALTSYGDYKAGQYDTANTQIKVGYSYDGHSAPNSFAGVIENDSMLWSHPPRDGVYAILELSPYPYLKLPLAAGDKWAWELAVGSQWGRAQLAAWKGNMLVHSDYRVTGQQAINTKLGRLKCWVVQAQANCPVGTSSLTTWYHPEYGFVKLNYQTMDGGRMEFALESAGMAQLNESFSLPIPPSLLK